MYSAVTFLDDYCLWLPCIMLGYLVCWGKGRWHLLISLPKLLRERGPLPCLRFVDSLGTHYPLTIRTIS